MKRVMNFIMLSCKRATELIEKKKHCNLSILKSLQLKMHLSMCKYCSNYFKQTSLLDSLMYKADRRSPEVADTTLLEERIITILKGKSPE